MRKILLFSIQIACTQNFVSAQWIATSGPSFQNGYVPQSTCMAIKGSTIFVGTAASGMFYSNNNGSSWTETTTGLTSSNIRKIAISGTNIFLATSSAGIFKSGNNGSSWTAVNNGGFSVLNGINCLSAVGTKLFCSPGANGGLYLSTDNGTLWTNVSSNLPNQFFTTVVGSGTNIFAGGLSGWGSGGVFLSTDDGSSWSAVNNGALTGGNISSLAINNSNIFAGGGNMFLSTDNGNNWVLINTGLSGYISSIIIDGTNIFAGTGSGVFLSTNNGTSWTPVNTGLGNLSIKALNISGTNIIAATDSLVWIRPLSEMTTGINKEDTDKNIQATIYPNPSNGFFSITLQNFTSKIQLEIYNILGERVYSAQINADKSEIDLGNKPKGIYFYHLQNDKKILGRGKVIIE